MVIISGDTIRLGLDESILSNEIALDEALDALDPLRHLRAEDDLNDRADQTIVPIQPRSTLDETIRLSFPSLNAHGNSAAISIALKLDASPGCGGVAWPAGEVLADYIARRGAQYCRGRTVLELGSGTGLVGLVAGALGGNVWITDQVFVTIPYALHGLVMHDSESARIVQTLIGHHATERDAE